MIVCYVVDLFLFARQNSLIDNVRDKLGKQFQVKDLAKLKRFFGTDLKWHLDGSVSIQQLQLITKVLKNTGMDKLKPVGSPIDLSFLTNRLNANPLMETNMRSIEVSSEVWFIS